MRIDEIITYLDALGGVLALRPQSGDGSPEIAWGDTFFYYAPDGVIPAAQPFATIVTKDYPDEPASRLDRLGAFRLNISAGVAEFQRLTGRAPRSPPGGDTGPMLDTGPAADDVIAPHPVYGGLGWVCVVNPGPSTATAVNKLLRTAHELARARYERRADQGAL